MGMEIRAVFAEGVREYELGVKSSGRDVGILKPMGGIFEPFANCWHFGPRVRVHRPEGVRLNLQYYH
ncbi:hypothetical protein D3C79_1010740 [compost metagenome]